MKKWLFSLMLLPMVAVAKPIDETQIFKEYMIQNNNLDKCLFPEIYRSSDKGEKVLEKWWNNEERGRMKRAYYLKLKMRLAQKVMPTKLAESFLFGQLSYTSQQQYEEVEKHYRKMVSAKSPKACKKVEQYAINLIEEYDELNNKWRIEFPNP